ncbi:MAG: alanine--tRNA ligase, partial [Clostridia bacterium]|nr:alanine--tRNA ligase [Clostridia bacterium]
PSVYESDDEAYKIWTEDIGVPAKRVVKLGKADNFWEHGSGPCGPCSEIYFDRGEKYGCGSPDCKPGCDCDRFMEIWNNVFSQFNNDGNGNYTELAQKNIDTGMGLERLACVMQGVDNMFEVDTIRKVIDKTCEIAGKKYGDNAENDISIRVVTDHSRSAMFMISDGVIPSNEGRGYVLRRIIRRACRHGKLLGINHPFLVDTVTVSIGESCGAYPELAEKKDYILKVIALEEERFDATVDAGLNILSEVIEKAKSEGKTVISGEDAFKLYDTFGFPIDLTREIAEEAGLALDNDSFNALMQEQRARARAARGNISGWSESSKDLLHELDKTEFTGYGSTETKDCKVLAIVIDDNTANEVNEGEFSLVLDKTPFYGEGGGQVGDNGHIFAGDLMIEVSDTKKTDGVYIHICKITEGSGTLKVGDSVWARVDESRRSAIMRSHSAAHLLQAALRTVLGNHVSQAGSYVDENETRFDFTHFAAMTEDELQRVEAIVNFYVNDKEIEGVTLTEYEKLSEVKITATQFDEVYTIYMQDSDATGEDMYATLGAVAAEMCNKVDTQITVKTGYAYPKDDDKDADKTTGDEADTDAPAEDEVTTEAPSSDAAPVADEAEETTGEAEGTDTEAEETTGEAEGTDTEAEEDKKTPTSAELTAAFDKWFFDGARKEKDMYAAEDEKTVYFVTKAAVKEV